MCHQALMASGRTDRLLRSMIWVVATQISCVGAGATFGLMGAGMGYVVSQVISVAIWLATTRAIVGFEWKELLQELRCSAVLAGITAIAPLSSLALFGLRPSLVLAPLISSTLLGILLFVLAARWLRHPIYEEIAELMSRLKKSGNRT